MTSKKVTHYLAMWDMLGLECILNVTEFMKEHELWQKKKIWQVLKEEKFQDIGPTLPLQQMILRARVNAQRSYEIYEFNSTMSQKEIEQLFSDTPQVIVDWIRKHGYKVYSDYSKSKRKVIS